MRFDRSTGRQNLGTGCGYGKENGVVVWWCGVYIVQCLFSLLYYVIW